jgi:hypothetical protein
MSSDYTDKDTFMARHGSAEHIDSVIRGGIEPLVRTVLKNHLFDQEHHRQMMNHRLPYMRHLALYSPHVTTDEVSHMMHNESQFPMAVGTAMQHKLSRVEDVKKVAFEHPLKTIAGAAVRIVHDRGGWTPDELKRIGNRLFPGSPTEHMSIPMHIWNSTMPRSSQYLSQTDVNNAMVKERGGTLK